MTKQNKQKIIGRKGLREYITAGAAAVLGGAAVIQNNKQKKDIESNNEKITNVETDLEKAKTDITDLSTDLNTSKLEITDLIEAADTQIKNLGDGLNAANTGITNLNAGLNAANDQIQTLQETTKTLDTDKILNESFTKIYYGTHMSSGCFVTDGTDEINKLGLLLADSDDGFYDVPTKFVNPVNQELTDIKTENFYYSNMTGIYLIKTNIDLTVNTDIKPLTLSTNPFNKGDKCVIIGQNNVKHSFVSEAKTYDDDGRRPFPFLRTQDNSYPGIILDMDGNIQSQGNTDPILSVMKSVMKGLFDLAKEGTSKQLLNANYLGLFYNYSRQPIENYDLLNEFEPRNKFKSAFISNISLFSNFNGIFESLDDLRFILAYGDDKNSLKTIGTGETQAKLQDLTFKENSTQLFRMLEFSVDQIEGGNFSNPSDYFPDDSIRPYDSNGDLDYTNQDYLDNQSILDKFTNSGDGTNDWYQWEWTEQDYVDIYGGPFKFWFLDFAFGNYTSKLTLEENLTSTGEIQNLQIRLMKQYFTNYGDIVTVYLKHGGKTTILRTFDEDELPTDDVYFWIDIGDIDLPEGETFNIEIEVNGNDGNAWFFGGIKTVLKYYASTIIEQEITLDKISDSQDNYFDYNFKSNKNNMKLLKRGKGKKNGKEKMNEKIYKLEKSKIMEKKMEKKK